MDTQGIDHSFVSYMHWDLGRLLLDTGRPADAEVEFRRALELRLKSLQPGHFEIARSQGWLGASLTRLGRFEEAESLLVPAYEALAAEFRPYDKRVTDVATHAAALYRAWGKEGEAKKYEAAAGRASEWPGAKKRK